MEDEPLRHPGHVEDPLAAKDRDGETLHEVLERLGIERAEGSKSDDGEIALVHVRPRVMAEIAELIVRMAKENPGGGTLEFEVRRG